MGIIRHVSEERQSSLVAETMVGRSRKLDLILADDFVSGVHAVIRWSDGGWEIKDLGSSNGTSVNGKPLGSGEKLELRRGDRISFGGTAATWQLVDDGPPEPSATSEEDEVVRGKGGLLILPSAENPRLCVARNVKGHWQVEGEEGNVLVRNGQELVCEGKTWTLQLPAPASATRTAGGDAALTLRGSRLCFTPCADGDVEVAVVHGPRRSSFPLGAHGRVILTLARARVEGEGWMDRNDLLRDLRMTSNHLNVAVHRARRQFASAGFVDAVLLVERDGKRIRLGAPHVTIAATG